MNGEMPWQRFIWIPSLQYYKLFKAITFCNIFVWQEFYNKNLDIFLFEEIEYDFILLLQSGNCL